MRHVIPTAAVAVVLTAGTATSSGFALDEFGSDRSGTFNFLDSDSSGDLTPAELRGTSAMPYFFQLDHDGDGRVTGTEFDRRAPVWIHSHPVDPTGLDVPRSHDRPNAVQG